MSHQSPLPSTIGHIVNDQNIIRHIQARISAIVGSRDPTWFPGSQPVSFILSHIDALMKEDYFVCEKSDGVRYLMLIARGAGGQVPAAYLIDRKYQIRVITFMHFPLESNPKMTHHETLLDGELVMDLKPDGRRVLRYLVFDMLALEGKSVCQLLMHKRLGYAEQYVVKPRQKLLQQSPDYAKIQPFRVEMKEMQVAYQIDRVFREVLPRLQHGNDGLIFTPINREYTLGTCREILKWKPPHMNSIDFKLIIQSETDTNQVIYELYAGRKGNLYFFDWFTPEETERDGWLKNPPHDAIIECRYDAEWVTDIMKDGKRDKRVGGWRFMRIREDKDKPNEEYVVQSIISSIKENITEDYFMSISTELKTAWINRHASTKKRLREDPE